MSKKRCDVIRYRFEAFSGGATGMTSSFQEINSWHINQFVDKRFAKHLPFFFNEIRKRLNEIIAIRTMG